MKINELLAHRGVKIPRGIYIGLLLHTDPLPELCISTTQGDDPLTVITKERLLKLVDDLNRVRREVIETGVCGMPLAQLILSPDRPRREVIANLEHQRLLALQKMTEHVLVNFGIEEDDLSGQCTARLVLEIEHLIRYRADEDVHAPSAACERVKAAVLAHHVRNAASNTTIQ